MTWTRGQTSIPWVIILYELCQPRCRPPFGGSDARLKEFHLTVPAPRLAEARRKHGVYHHSLPGKNPADRYQSVWELLDDLENGYDNNRSQDIPKKPEGEEAISYLEEIWDEASLWFSKGDFNEAARLTEEVLSIDPEHVQARRLKEELKMRFDQAKRFYHEIDKDLEGGKFGPIS